MDYNTKNNIVYSCIYHVVWCPKYRRPVLHGEVEARLKELIEEACAETEVEIKKMDIYPDYVHLLLAIDPQLGIHRAVKTIKAHSSRELRLEFPHLRSRIPTLWTHSYFVSTAEDPPISLINQYVENQRSV